MPKKFTYDYVKNIIENEGYTLLSDNYKNNRTKIELICPYGHEYKVTFGDFYNSGSRCPLCYNKKRNKDNVLKYDYVKNYIEQKGYTLLSVSYKNSKQKLLVRCHEGHEYKVTFNNFKQKNSGCYECLYGKKRTIDDVKNIIEKEKGYTLLSTSYKSNKDLLDIMCGNGHIYKTTLSTFLKGHRCSVCFYDKLKHTYDDVKKYIESFGYKLLSTSYKGVMENIKVKCQYGHTFNTSFNRFLSGKRCPICWNESTSSKQEQGLQDYIESLGYDIVRNDRTQIINPLTGKHLELDIWIPDKNKAIEYNGTYWHSNKYQQVKDKIKINQCKENSIDLMIVDDIMWNNNNAIIKNTIKMWINESNNSR